VVRRVARSDEGAVIVEFGVVFPILALLILGVIAAGDLFSTQVALQHAAREGARAMALYQEDQAATVAQDAVRVPITVETGEVCDPENMDPQPTSLRVLHSWQGLGPIGAFELEATAVMRCGG
jgi:Flp pilus assembly pilin Flp